MIHENRWTIPKIEARLNLIAPLIHRRRAELTPFRFKALAGPDSPPPVDADVDDRGWEIIPPESYWGDWGLNFALRTQFHIPEDWDSGLPVALHLPLGEAGDFSHPEALAYINGRVHAACDRHHQEIYLPDRIRDSQSHNLTLHGWTGLSDGAAREAGTRLYMRTCAVVQIDTPTRDFVTLARVTLGIIQQIDDDTPTRNALLNALNAAFNRLETRAPLGDDFYASVPAALDELRSNISTISGSVDVDIIAIGHAHIDVAWLWTLAQTRHKAARSFSTVLRLMEEFPDYHFSQSQAQLYAYIEEDQPELFEEIRARVAEGRWEVMGGTWVEPDCNAIGAESLARQFLLGRSYFRARFGDVDTPVLWLPDTFGYAWSLPQLIKEAGMDYFVTHKMSWNQFNHMPYQNLWWQGIDGTRVLTHFLTTPEGNVYLPHSTTYNGDLSPQQIIGTWRNYRQKAQHTELTTVYGYGDGGGGPTREMLSSLEPLADHPGAPRVRPGTVREYMANLNERAGDSLPVWNGEFYLEYHRGTYTSQARTKRANRKSEFLLHDAEFLATWAAQITDYAYPYDDLRHAWELVCLNQFHDILPGSSIGPVYVDSDRDYAEIRALGERIRDDALAALTARFTGTFVAVNPTSFASPRAAFVPDNIPAGHVFTNANGEPLLSQPVDGGTLTELNHIDAYSLHPLKITPGEPITPDDAPRCGSDGDTFTLENAALRLEFNADGEIKRLYDEVADREVLPAGERANVFQFFEDRPLNYDAWDIDIFYDDKQWAADPGAAISIIETGPVRAGLEITRRFQNSSITQRVFLYRRSRRIDFDTRINWHDQHILFKVAFPVDVLNPMATYDIQWGNVQRPTHHNTSWDWARFETCAYKWVDLSEGDYGLSVLNDCKHGHDIHDNVIRLTLLKSATHPDPNADQGEHRVTYSLLPHIGAWNAADTVAASYDLNDPVIVHRSAGGGNIDNPESFLSLDAGHVIIETVKTAEDGRGVIVRLYENERRRGPVTLRAGFAIKDAFRCNLLEEDGDPLTVTNDSVTVNIKPYQIITLRLIPG